MDASIKESPIKEHADYVILLTALQEKRAEIICNMIDSIMEKFKDFSGAVSGGTTPVAECPTVTYKFYDSDYAEINVEKESLYKMRTEVSIRINRKSGRFTLYAPVYGDYMTIGSPYKNRIIDLHLKHFPELKADYDI